VRVAISREKQLKRWRREKKVKLIENINPHWNDLGENWGSRMVFPQESIRELRKKAEGGN
jgi:putative endonuclease